MKKWKLPRLSRGQRIVRNLVFWMLTAVFVWGLYDFPLPPRLAFRRMERENLLGRSDIQGVFQNGGDLWIVFGVQGDQVVFSGPFEPEFWPRAEEGPVLIPIENFGSFPTEVLFAAADVPEGTVSAVLELSADGWTASSGNGKSFSGSREKPEEDLPWIPWACSCRVEGRLLKDGGVLFQVTREEAPLEDVIFWLLSIRNTYQQSAGARGLNCRMEAVFYDKTGTELGRAALDNLGGGETNDP